MMACQVRHICALHFFLYVTKETLFNMKLKFLCWRTVAPVLLCSGLLEGVLVGDWNEKPV